jgi:hypothetical protein
MSNAEDLIAAGLGGTPAPAEPCERCSTPTAEANMGEAWGRRVCLRCLGDWHNSPEVTKAQRQLNPMPLWERCRLEAAGKPTPPWPTSEETARVYRAATEAWLRRTRRVAA